MTKLIHCSAQNYNEERGCLFWNAHIPIKVNIFLWRFLSDAIPTHFNLSKRGVPIHSMECVLCGNSVETSDHVFFSYPLAANLWRKIRAWWDVKYSRLPSTCSFKLLAMQMGRFRKWDGIFTVVCGIAIWRLWKWRNEILFAKMEEIPNKRSADSFLMVQSLSKLWIGNRIVVY